MRPWLAKSGLLVATTLFSLLFAECAVRLVAPQDLGIWSGRRDGLFVLQPGLRARPSRWDQEIVVNHLGFRGPEPTPQKSALRPRVLILGDSFIEAVQIAWPDSMSSRIESRLAERGRPAEVLSAGVSGWGTDAVVQYLSTDGMALEPDVIVVAVTIYNDVLDNLGEPFHRLQAGRLVHHDESALSSAAYFDLLVKSYLSTHSHLYQLVRSSTRRASTPNAFSSLQHHWADLLRTEPPPRLEYGWALTEALLDRLARLAEQQGARLSVVLIPMEEQLSDDRANAFLTEHQLDRTDVDLEAPQKRLVEWGRRSGVEVIDLLERFREHDRTGGDSTYLTDDGHWNVRGHAIAGEFVADVLIEQVLPTPPQASD